MSPSLPKLNCKFWITLTTPASLQMPHSIYTVRLPRTGSKYLYKSVIHSYAQFSNYLTNMPVMKPKSINYEPG
jgi:hypothetical protein